MSDIWLDLYDYKKFNIIKNFSPQLFLTPESKVENNHVAAIEHDWAVS